MFFYKSRSMLPPNHELRQCEKASVRLGGPYFYHPNPRQIFRLAFGAPTIAVFSKNHNAGM